MLVHGWLLGRWMMRKLGARLTKQGFEVFLFGYRSRALSLNQHAADLARFANNLGLRPAHVVGHSLGGLIAACAIHEHGYPAGRAVMLGSPLNGSVVARRLARLPGGRWLLGRVARALQDGYALPANREVGLIIGTRHLGAGLLLGAPRPGDGTVTVDEAQAPGATDSCRLPVTHTSMVVSKGVFHEVVHFLRKGLFSGEKAHPRS